MPEFEPLTKGICDSASGTAHGVALAYVLIITTARFIVDLVRPRRLVIFRNFTDPSTIL
jgi:hypothetical protein